MSTHPANVPPGWTVPFDEAGDLVRAAGQRMALARVTSLLLGTTALVLLVVGRPIAEALGGSGDLALFVGMAAAAIWVFLGVNAARHGRRVREAAALASVGRVDLAEGRARESLESFCLLRTVTVGAAAVLARVRFGQGRHAEAARLAQFVLRRRERALGGEKRGVRLLLAESLLATGDAHAALAAAAPLYTPARQPRDQLTLADTLRLLAVQLTADGQLGRWDAIRAALPAAVPMVELMPSPDAAKLFALLAEADGDASGWSSYLRRRAELIAPEASQ